eukprot:Gb_37001 [translate_table: standard]
MHFGAEKHGHCDESNYRNLSEFEDINEGTSFHQQNFPVKARLEKLHFA